MKVPSEMRDDWIECPKCKHEFVPNDARRVAAKQKNDQSTYMMVLGVAAVVLIGIVILASGGGEKKQPKDNDDDKNTTVETGQGNPRVAAMVKFVQAICEQSESKAALYVDLRSKELRADIGMTDIDGTVDELNQRTLTALVSSERLKFLHEATILSGRTSETDAEADVGRVTVNLAVRPENAGNWQSDTGSVSVGFKFEGTSSTRATSLRINNVPQAKAIQKPSGPRASKHEILGTAQKTTRQVGGQTVEAIVADPRPLPHLDITPEADRQKIDKWIAGLIDAERPTPVARVSLQLGKFQFGKESPGKAAVPRLLTALYDLQQQASSDERNFRIKSVTAVLSDLTGQRFGFDPSSNRVFGRNAAQSAARDKDRQTALKEWFGWWAENHWRDNVAYAIDEGDDLEIEDKDGKK